MWTMIPSLQAIVDGLAPAFTQPCYATSCEFLLAWVMCLGKRTLLRVAYSADPRVVPDRSQRHDLDVYYNFFERSAWSPAVLAQRVAILAVKKLALLGRLVLLTDDTLTHKCGKSVWGLGWWRDAVASTKKRVATAPGHNWVVMALAVCLPGTNIPILAIPLLARLHQPGKGQPSCPQLARQMLEEVMEWFPGYDFTLVGDGAYACKELLADLPAGVTFVGRLRGDAALYDPQVPVQPTSKRGPKPQKGPRLPCPRDAAKKADHNKANKRPWLWRKLSVFIYGSSESLGVLCYQALWPRVLGTRPIAVSVVRDLSGKMNDVYLFSTDLQASPGWVIQMFAWRWAIEVLFRSSKQTLDIEAPQHWCQASVEKVAPWVWSMQSVIMVWYLTAGRALPQAEALRARLGEWDSEWSLRHMMQVMRHVILDETINPNSADVAQLRQMLQTLKNWANLAA
jgi:hypothetical protein